MDSALDISCALNGRRIVIGGTYRHFKGNDYVVEGIACDTETLELNVIYRSLYGHPQFGTDVLWSRSLEAFASEVDHEKYPEVTQRYRFELVQP